MKTEVSNEFILKAHKMACGEWKAKIEKECPDLFPKVKEGEYYWMSNDGCNGIGKFKGDRLVVKVCPKKMKHRNVSGLLDGDEEVDCIVSFGENEYRRVNSTSANAVPLKDFILSKRESEMIEEMRKNK